MKSDPCHLRIFREPLKLSLSLSLSLSFSLFTFSTSLSPIINHQLIVSTLHLVRPYLAHSFLLFTAVLRELLSPLNLTFLNIGKITRRKSIMGRDRLDRIGSREAAGRNQGNDNRIEKSQ